MFEHNFETNTVLYGTDFALQIQKEFDGICADYK